MRDRPEGLDESALRRALTAWGVDGVSLAYAPVGFGDYHWTAVDDRERRWFVTVADLAHKPHCGTGTDAAFRGLRRAMDTAAALRDRPGLDFVVAPLRDAGGRTLRRLGDRHGVSVFPYLDGSPGDFGQALTPAERGAVVELLARLHRAAPPASVPLARPAVPARAGLEAALDELGAPWHGGPFAEPARALLSEHAAGLRRRLDEFDRRIRELADGGREPVVTHGEPHPGNLLRLGGHHLLVDWDTVGLAVPERDLWMVAAGPDDLERYADAGGRRPDPSALALYRLRWDLDDTAVYLASFRTPHGRTPDTEQAWEGLAGTLARLTGEATG
ncbi:phosphotransferase [Allostreptomyces psammosilenae]|uniref:Spectinomycin phosphotransferase n=1 Tax=Allostreptomyces psammosilenae TaxID=1892865 RepID=A0A852ZTB3_9ACTN|nr:phosphotransferase [Allostreptomyces psammosilenae]NYI04777.1 spectinomycin phosphotransferase [Allostreptomyces psammosilenae]